MIKCLSFTKNQDSSNRTIGIVEVQLDGKHTVLFQAQRGRDEGTFFVNPLAKFMNDQWHQGYKASPEQLKEIQNHVRAFISKQDKPEQTYDESPF